METRADTIIVGTGAAGLFCALCLPQTQKILIITKDKAENSDSFLAQGGICMLKSPEDYASYFEDTMKAGHYQNNPDAVRTMIEASPHIIEKLESYGVAFQKEKGSFVFTREGAHSTPRILYHDDVTGKEITGKLLKAVKKKPNIQIYEQTVMTDLICREGRCLGITVKMPEGGVMALSAGNVVLATGGIGGLFKHSTNYPHITGDGLAMAIRHRIPVENINYIQIHPTTLYTKKPGRSFLISESVRGEGGILLNKRGHRFVNELLPRDLLTEAIEKQKAEDGLEYVRLSVVHLGEEAIKKRFPNIYRHCLEEGYDMTKEPIPVTPAQHYFMGGIKVDLNSKTGMNHLYAVGETSCNGVHGANRLASNSLLESLVFAERAAQDIASNAEKAQQVITPVLQMPGQPEELVYKQLIFDEIRRKDNHFYEQWCNS